MVEDGKSDGKLNGWIDGHINRKEGRTDNAKPISPPSAGDYEPFNNRTFNILACRY